MMRISRHPASPAEKCRPVQDTGSGVELAAEQIPSEVPLPEMQFPYGADRQRFPVSSVIGKEELVPLSAPRLR